MTARSFARGELQRALRLGRTIVAARNGAPSPPRVPDGWVLGSPDFIGLGARGAAVLWWLAEIERHPDVARAPGAPAATHWIDRYWEHPLPADPVADYARWFPRPKGAIAGEWASSYLSSFWVAPLLPRVAPDARILVLLADPQVRFLARVARAVAARPRRWDERDAIGAFSRGLHAEALRELLRRVPQDRVLLLLEESCRANPEEQLARTFAHLGLAADGPLQKPATRPPPAPKDPADRVPEAVRRAVSAAYARELEQLTALAPELEFERWSIPARASV